MTLDMAERVSKARSDPRHSLYLKRCIAPRITAATTACYILHEGQTNITVADDAIRLASLTWDEADESVAGSQGLIRADQMQLYNAVEAGGPDLSARGMCSVWATSSGSVLSSTRADETLGIIATTLDRLHSFAKRVEEQLYEQIEDAAEEEIEPPTLEAINRCRLIADAIAPELLFARNFLLAATIVGDGHAALVVQSLHARRRLTLHVSAEGRVESLVRIDENEDLRRDPVSDLSDETIQRLARWVVHPIQCNSSIAISS